MYSDFYTEPLTSQHYAINQLVDSKVMTNRGSVKILDLNPDDIVYEYNTGNPIRIRGITKCEPQPIYEILYTDGRSMKIPEYEMIYTGKDIHQLHLLKDIMDSFMFDEIRPCVIDFNHGNVVNPLRVDPYIAGALITYGDWDIPYINLPLWKPEIADYFCNTNIVEYGGIISASKVLFTWRTGYPSSSHLITWDDFFPYQCYSVAKRLDYDMFPIEYVTACLRDKMKFIRGIFDVGYDNNISPENISIYHHSEFRLKEIQKILWSVGILSRVVYSPDMIHANSWKISENMKWRLDILGDSRISPAIFYDINNIEHFVNYYYDDIYGENLKRVRFIPKSVNITPRFDLSLKIEKIQACIGSGYMYNIVTEYPCMVYVTDNYLPRVSSI